MIFKELDTLTKCCGWINSRNGELYNNIDLVTYERTLEYTSQKVYR